MPHVTLIHGLSNKPEKDVLLRIWRTALARGAGGLDLGASGVSTSMVYWADVLYPAPDPKVADYESVNEANAESVDGSGDATIPLPENELEQAYLAGLRARFSDRSDDDIEQSIATEQGQGSIAGVQDLSEDAFVGENVKLERIPLPWFIKKRIMAALLRDAYLYQFNKMFSPRPGVSYQVQDEIRRRFVEQLKASQVTRPHIVVSHSMGTMIAYDCLKRVADCPPIDGLITMGSPLGLDEVQDGFKPEWTRTDGFPSNKVVGDWTNFFDRLDVVCAADPKLSGDFRDAGADRIQDIAVKNDGAWRHSVVKYLARTEVRQSLRKMLGIAPI